MSKHFRRLTFDRRSHWFISFADRKSGTWRSHSTSKMLKCLAKCWISTKTCTISKWCLAWYLFTYCAYHFKSYQTNRNNVFHWNFRLFSLQTFAIPGSLFLSILCGFLFDFPIALGLVCFCSALGATLCYLLSQLVGRRLVKHYFPARAASWSQQVDKHKNELLMYMLFLRMTPFLPNWFINLVAPVIGVPLFPFAVGTFFGKKPPRICSHPSI